MSELKHIVILNYGEVDWLKLARCKNSFYEGLSALIKMIVLEIKEKQRTCLKPHEPQAGAEFALLLNFQNTRSF